MTIKTTTTMLALTAVIGLYGCTTDRDSNKQAEPIQIQQERVTEQRFATLEDMLMNDIATHIGCNPSTLTAERRYIHTSDFPLPGYISGQYIVIAHLPTTEEYIYSSRGELLTHYLRTEESQGRERTIKTTFFTGLGSEIDHVRSIVRGIHDGERTTLYIDQEEAGTGFIERRYRVHPVFKRNGNRFEKAHPYAGGFGGDGEHTLVGRSRGTYFVVFHETLNTDRHILSQKGEIIIKVSGEREFGNVDETVYVRHDEASGKFSLIHDSDPRQQDLFIEAIPEALR